MLSTANLAVVDADVHPALVAQHVVDAVRDRLPQFPVNEIVYAYAHGAPLRLPFYAPVSPSSSFFFVSTEMTGSSFRWNCFTRRLMYLNCASGSPFARELRCLS